MSLRLYIPKDAAARAVGADELAAALQMASEDCGSECQIIRTGSRGLLWLETLLEVETIKGRFGYGPVTTEDIPSLIAAGLFNGAKHPLDHRTAVGLVAEHPLFKAQTRQSFARCGLIDPLDGDGFVAQGGLRGIKAAVKMDGEQIVKQVTDSGLRGRGGAGFPTGIKWQTVRNAESSQKYIVCNADEGDSGTFADRILIEGDPLTLIEGMVIAGLAVGASKGYIYIRSEYPDGYATLLSAVLVAHRLKLLGANVMGSGKGFELEIRLGAGAYICGEETSLLESLEGRRGIIRYKPPLPAIKGLFGQPTVINNVLSFAAVPGILADGAESYSRLGVGRSKGTLAVQLGGNIKRGGLFELPFGVTLRTILNDFGGGSASGRPIRAVQVGGPLGAYFPESLFDLPLDYEEFAKHQGMVGHGGIVVFDDSVDLARQARFAMEFCAIESCGKCTPCRIGSTRGVEVLDRIIAGTDRDKNLVLLNDLCTTMQDGSLCALGGLTPLPVRSALKHFAEDFA
ncbi:MAG: NADH-ubiquinone oxidoreductase-F iron-sulfur binding region domain-containing protein [Candidatus Pacebacteria bacterium]|nr:NADH-ubiquinone oxidoreductase-F iron-sulfur binding region domain-containing protein [Candidatus Paceibacterota bacterium]